MTAPLTAAAVIKAKAGPKKRLIKDGGARSLYLVVQPGGHKSWLMRFRNVNGAPAKLTLGSVDLSGKEFEGTPVIGQQLTLAAARLLAAEKLRARAMGNDVFADHAAAKRRRHAEHEQAAANTFGGLARQFIEEHAQRKTRRWRQTARVWA